MRSHQQTRLALLGPLTPAERAAVSDTVLAWTERAAVLTAFVHRHLPRTLPPVTVSIAPAESPPKG